MNKEAYITVTALFALLSVFIVILGMKNNQKTQVEKAVTLYSEITENGIPENMCLSIYYISPYVWTRVPVSIADLCAYDDVRIIKIHHSELEEHYESLTKLDATALQTVTEKTGINARLYYVFEVDSEKVLEVVINGPYSSIYVNGVEVHNHPVFFELIAPFVDENFTNTWGNIEDIIANIHQQKQSS